MNNPFSLRRVLKLVRRGDYDYVKALADNRIKLFADTQQWMNYYVQNNVDFSFGSRIHGSIMPILSGVPAMCYTMDARTREMVEFFDIPHINSFDSPGNKSLYEWYLEADYSKFNSRFSERFDRFEEFLKNCGLVQRINQDNIFMTTTGVDYEAPDIVNKKAIQELNSMLKKNWFVINTLDFYTREFKEKKN